MRITELIDDLELFKSVYGDIEIAIEVGSTQQYADKIEVVASVRSEKYIAIVKGHEL